MFAEAAWGAPAHFVQATSEAVVRERRLHDAAEGGGLVKGLGRGGGSGGVLLARCGLRRHFVLSAREPL